MCRCIGTSFAFPLKEDVTNIRSVGNNRMQALHFTLGRMREKEKFARSSAAAAADDQPSRSAHEH